MNVWQKLRNRVANPDNWPKAIFGFVSRYVHKCEDCASHEAGFILCHKHVQPGEVCCRCTAVMRPSKSFVGRGPKLCMDCTGVICTACVLLAEVGCGPRCAVNDAYRVQPIGR
jgi:hypothetical protein